MSIVGFFAGETIEIFLTTFQPFGGLANSARGLGCNFHLPRIDSWCGPMRRCGTEFCANTVPGYLVGLRGDSGGLAAGMLLNRAVHTAGGCCCWTEEMGIARWRGEDRALEFSR